MRVPEFDRRSREDILRRIAANAQSYTPEWRFDRENPDLGTALALIYAELFSQTLRRFNRVGEKNMAAFLGSMDARLLPALPAEGYVCFGLAGSLPEGAEVKAGTPLLADADNEEGSTIFETADDLLVTAARPQQIFTVCGSTDTIVRNYDSRTDEGRPFTLFDQQGESLQQHTLYLAHEDLLELSAGARIGIELVPDHQRTLPPRLGQLLTDPDQAVWEYSCGSSWQPFAHCSWSENVFVLTLGEHQLPITPTEEPGLEPGRWLRLRLKKGVQLPLFSLRLIRLAAENSGLLPDLVYASDAGQNIHEFLPFGEELGLFSEVYFSCEEALIKRGAQVEMSFRLSYLPIPVDLTAGVPPVDWKLIMKKSDFKVDEEADITVAQVLWEYYNGTGWARLFPDGRADGCFTPGPEAATQDYQLRFRCPDDMAPVLVGSGVGCFIRARVLKINNLYKLKGHYVVPLISDLSFGYRYSGRGRLPQQVMSCNNGFCRPLDPAAFRGGNLSFQPFSFLDESQPALYLGFPEPPLGGPIKMLFLLAETLQEKPGRLWWEYRTEWGWESLNVVDETENLRQTGLLTMMGLQNFCRADLWGESLFWIRAVDETGCYAGNGAQLPRVTGLYMNGVRVKNLAAQPPERFFIEPEQQHFTCQLLERRVYHAEVWVNELETLTAAQMDELEQAGQLETVRDEAGILREAWVRWEEREDFALSDAGDRHYILDRNQGLITFSDGIHGRIPPAGRQETIEVRYTAGGGQIGNLPAGAINRSSRSLGFVNQIFNPRPTAGGCDQETFQQAIDRGGAALRHGGRAVTARDFEALALEATRNIVRARCFSNRDQQGRSRPGWVTLVVVLRDHQTGRDLLPTICGQVTDYIASRCGGNLTAMEHFHVVPPQFLELCVKAELTVGDFNQVFGVREELYRRLEAFLDPLTGNFDGKGWAVGQIPNDTQLRNCLNGVRGVHFLKSVSAAVFMETGSGRVELSPEQLKKQTFALPRSGEHTFMITVG